MDDVVRRFIAVVMDQAKHFKTNHIMLTMGSDFQYQNAHQVFKNLDKLIKYTNEKVRGWEGLEGRDRGRGGASYQFERGNHASQRLLFLRLLMPML